MNYIACDLIIKAGILGNYINPEDDDVLDHLASHFRREYWLPGLFVRERPQQWQAAKKDIDALAVEKVKKILASNDPHPLGKDMEKEIDGILEACVRHIVK